MSVVSKLIDVQYKDLTNYTAGVGDDILGIPFIYHWGPVGKLQVLDQNQFFQLYPEDLPSKVTFNPNVYFAYASIKKAYESGVSLTETVRAQGSSLYASITYSDGSQTSSEGTRTTPATLPETFVGSARISTKYPGVPPVSLTGVCDTVVVKAKSDADGSNLVIEVYAANYCTSSTAGNIEVSGATDTYVLLGDLLETFSGTTVANSSEDGISNYIVDLVNESQFISLELNPGFKFIPSTPQYFEVIQTVPDIVSISEIVAAYYSGSDAPIKKFEDGMISNATILMSPTSFFDLTTSSTLDTYLINVAKSRQDTNTVIGYPLTKTFDKEAIATTVGYLSGIRDKFSFYVAGRESYSIFGRGITLNCVAGWVGATFNIAKEVRTNQSASAFRYGAYNGILLKSLTFDDAADLMNSLGVTSVFNSTAGPLIWGIRSLNKNQSNYWARMNVMRVLAKILRQVFPIALEAIHTDAAANPVTKQSFQTLFNSVVSDEIARENLLGDSYANVLGEINNDYNTKGGKIFNIDLSLHFIGLVESIKIRVYATDSSVSTNI